MTTTTGRQPAAAYDVISWREGIARTVARIASPTDVFSLNWLLRSAECAEIKHPDGHTEEVDLLLVEIADALESGAA